MAGRGQLNTHYAPYRSSITISCFCRSHHVFHCNRNYRDLQNRQPNFPDFHISCSCRNIQFSFNSQSICLYLEDHLSTHPLRITKTYIKTKIAIIPSTQSKRINRQKRKRMLLIEWRMHFRTFIFQMCSMKTKPKANMSHTSSRKWGEIISLRLTLWCCQNTPTWSAMTLSHLCLSLNPTPVPLMTGSKCFNVRTQVVQFCMNKVYTNATSQYEGYITHSLTTRSWLKWPFGNHPRCKRDYCTKKWIKAAWNLTAEITVASDY